MLMLDVKIERTFLIILNLTNNTLEILIIKSNDATVNKTYQPKQSTNRNIVCYFAAKNPQKEQLWTAMNKLDK